MTIPFQFPQVGTPQLLPPQQQGGGTDELLRTIMGAMALQQEQQATQQRQQAAEHGQALDLFALGLQQPGFEESDAAGALAASLGVPTLPSDIASARRREKTASAKVIDDLVQSANVDPATRDALRVSLSIKAAGGTAELANDIFQRMAPEQLSELDRLNIRKLDLDVRQQLRDFTNTSSENQRRAFAVLGQPLGQFVEGINYVGVAEDFAKFVKEAKVRKEEELDPTSLIVNGAFRMMAQLVDPITGRPTATPAEALQLSTGIVSSIVPGAAQQVTITPELESQVQAMADAVAFISIARENKGRIAGRKFTDAQLQDQLRRDLRTKYGAAIEPVLETILSLAFRRAPTR